MSIRDGSQRGSVSMDPIRVLHVDDDPEWTAATAELLEHEDVAIETLSATSARDGLDRLSEAEIDCIVAEYELPDMDGLAFLDAVRAADEELPFILFTGSGSEAIASEAISAGVTDYVRKESSPERDTNLANRVVSAVETARSRLQRHRQLRAIETAQEGISILDDEGRLVYVNGAYAELYGYDAAEMIGEHWSILYPDDEIEAVREEIIPTVLTEGDWHGETTGLRATGETFVEGHSLSTTGNGDLICTVQDITERKERERELERYETILEAIPDEVYALDADGRFTKVVPPINAELTTAGYRPDELVGEHVSTLMDADDIDRAESIIETLVKADDRDHESFEMETIAKDGERVPNENHIAVFPPDEEGTFQGTVGVLRDITARKARERELKAQNERLDQFAGIVSHDLRNPLNVAQGRLEQARENCDCAGQDETLESIPWAHDRMAVLIENILTIARDCDHVPDTEPIDLATITENCWQHVETADATIRIETDAVVRADRSRLTQLLENLIRNAVEHGGPTVAITVGDITDADGGGFSVADDGPGVPPDESDQVFESGYSSAGGGTGLGLAIVERIAEDHGWTATVTEGEDGGARFEITGVDPADPVERRRTDGDEE